MSPTGRTWIRLLIVAAFLFGSALGGLSVHAAHDGHAGDGHASGLAPSEVAGVWHANGCDDPAHVGGHCAEVHCCASAVHAGSGRPAFAPLAGDEYLEWGPPLHAGRLSNPLLRPPIATA